MVLVLVLAASQVQQSTSMGKAGKYRLLLSVLALTKTALSLGVVPRIILIVFKLSQPFLTNSAIKYVHRGWGLAPNNITHGLVAAAGLIYFGMAIATGYHQHKLF